MLSHTEVDRQEWLSYGINQKAQIDPSKDVCTGIFVMKDVNRQPGLK